VSGINRDVSPFLPRGSATGRFTLLTKSQSGGQMPTDAEFEAAMRAIRSIRTKGAKVHEEVIYAYAHAAVVAAEIATVYCGGWRTARCMIRPQYEPRRWPMALQGEAKKRYHREYMRRQRAGLPTRGVVKPKVMEQWCSECVLPPSPERIVVSLGSGYRLCQCCYEAAGALFAAERAMRGR
jgi:hypothetical protein